MQLHYNLKGPERKALVAAISQALNAPMEYLGAPTFAFKVGDYHIDKNGTLTGNDNLDLEDALHQKGFNAEERRYDEPDTYESGLGGMGVVPEFDDLLLTESEELGLGRTRREDFQGENGMQASDCWSDGSNRLNIEMPVEGFTAESITNLEKLIASKANLIKKTIGADELPIERTDTTLIFPWFTYSSSIEEVAAFARFVAALCNTAKNQKRVTAREKVVENEKFAFRVFLIRLGLVGSEFKNVRKILLQKLDGNSAYKNGGPKKSSDTLATEVPYE